MSRTPGLPLAILSRTSAAGVLGLAAALKVLGPGNSFLPTSLSLEWLGLVEGFLAVWLIIGFRSRLAARVVAVTLAGFASVAAYQARNRSWNCGCFGVIEIDPRVMAVVDLVSAIGLCLTHSPACVLSRGFCRSVCTIAVAQLILSVLLIGLVGRSWQRGGGSNNTGAMLSFLSSIVQTHTELASGRWCVVVLQPGCGECDFFLRRTDWLSEVSDESRICFVFLREQDDSMLRHAQRLGLAPDLICVTDGHTLPLKVPARLKLESGRLISISAD